MKVDGFCENGHTVIVELRQGQITGVHGPKGLISCQIPGCPRCGCAVRIATEATGTPAMHLAPTIKRDA